MPKLNWLRDFICIIRVLRYKIISQSKSFSNTFGFSVQGYLWVKVLWNLIFDFSSCYLLRWGLLDHMIKRFALETITLNVNFSLAGTHHKLKFDVHWLRTCYFVNMLVTMLYWEYFFIWSWRVQFLTYKLRENFLEMESLRCNLINLA